MERAPRFRPQEAPRPLRLVSQPTSFFPFLLILNLTPPQPSAIPALVAAAATTRTPVIALAGPGAPPGAAVSALEAGAADVVGAPLRLADAAAEQHQYCIVGAGPGGIQVGAVNAKSLLGRLIQVVGCMMSIAWGMLHVSEGVCRLSPFSGSWPR